MGVRRGRLLPSVMIGGVLATGMAFGVGTASAADTTCKIGDDSYKISDASLVQANADGDCTLAGVKVAVTDDLAADGLTLVPKVTTAPPAVTTTTPAPTTPVTPTSSAPATDADAAKAAAAKAAAEKAAADKAAADKAAADRAAAAQAAAAAAAAKPVVLPADSAVGGSLLSVDPTALGGAPVAANFFGLGTYNPGLLLAAPFGSPLRNLANTDPASAVTTASQVQAMAFDGLPEGVGIPAVLGVLILAGLGGVAVRHRILSGARSVDTDEDRTEA